MSGHEERHCGCGVIGVAGNAGEQKPGLLQDRHRSLNIGTEQRRRDRQDLVPLAHPHAGVDALQGRLDGSTRPIPGVTDRHGTGAAGR